MATKSTYDRQVVVAFNKAIRALGASPKVAKALFEAGIVESGLRNLDYGDRDSLGPLQQRPSQGWRNATDPYRGALDFLRQAIPLASKYGSSGQLAQAVQRSAFPGRYDQQSQAAQALLGGSSVGQAPASRTVTTPTPMVDTSGERKAAVAQFLGQGGVKNSAATLALASTIAALRNSTQPSASPTQTRVSPSTRTSGSGGSKVLELIYNDGGNGYGIKNGQAVTGSQVFGAVWNGHRDHVHVAAGPNTVVKLGRLAQSMGLNVGENPKFGGVDPVHVPGSYHYKGEAIDVSGDPAKMAAFARRVERYNRTRKL